MALAKPFAYTRISQGWGPTARLDEPEAWAYLGRAWPSLNAQSTPREAFRHYDHFHTALDLAAPEGTPIQAMESGKITAAGVNPKSKASGIRVRVTIRGTGSSQVQYGFGHCQRIATNPRTGKLFAVGDSVKRGEVIAYVGHTGTATGPHAHAFVQIGFMLYDLRLFWPGGANANDARIRPL